MADAGLNLERARDLRGRIQQPWVRRAILGLVAVPVVLALAGALGRRATTP